MRSGLEDVPTAALMLIALGTTVAVIAGYSLHPFTLVAGTTHEVRQQSAELYGGRMVPGQGWDPARDHVLQLSSNELDGAPILNGKRDADTLTWRVGEKHRLRLMNVTLANAGVRFRLVGPNGGTGRWVALAEDGRDLPRPLRVLDRADVNVTIGRTKDFGFMPTRPGEHRLEVRSAHGTLLGLQVIRVEPNPEETT
jgi:hypothetical protein